MSNFPIAGEPDAHESASQTMADNAVVLGGRVIPYDDLVDRHVIERGSTFLETFSRAEPFSHVVFENLFSRSLLDSIVAEFDAPRGVDWLTRDTEREKIHRSRPTATLGPAAQTYFNILNSGRFIQFLQAATGIPGLLPDPLLRGGGMHESQPGGKFNLHLDFEKHAVTMLNNRLVFITYLNRDWRREYGGCLELWDMAQNRCVRDVIPEFGRSILMHHSDKSYHGHPHPVKTPDGRPRRSVAAYYYTNGRDDAATGDRLSTFFAPPPDPSPTEAFLRIAKAITPPILISAAQLVKSKVSARRKN
jgi:hypothetical protein